MKLCNNAQCCISKHSRVTELSPLHLKSFHAKLALRLVLNNWTISLKLPGDSDKGDIAATGDRDRNHPDPLDPPWDVLSSKTSKKNKTWPNPNN